MPAAIEMAISSGGRSISIEHNSPIGSRGILHWASKQSGSLVVVAPRAEIAAWADGMLESLSAHGAYSDKVVIAASDLTKMMQLPSLGPDEITTLILLENHSELDDLVFEFADRVRADNPDVVVVHEHRFRDDRDMPETDAIARRATIGYDIELISPPAPGL